MICLDKIKFGTYIKEKRIEHGYTQKSLADLLIVDVTTVSKWERGINYPDITMIPDICRYLEVNEHELIESSNDTRYREIAAAAEKFRKIKDAVFYSFSGCYILAVIICFAVNLVQEHRLTWFFPAAAGCLCGFTFIPGCVRFFEKYRLCAYLGSTWLSLTLLFISCSVYTKNYWFYIASSGVLLGYFIIFFPVLAVRQKKYLAEAEYRKTKKYFAVLYFCGILVLSLLVFTSVNVYNSSYDFYTGLKVMLFCFMPPVLWGAAELLPLKRLSKLGIDFMVSGIHLYSLNGVLNYFIGDNGIDYYRIDFGNWETCVNGNTAIIGLIALSLTGIVMLIISAVSKGKK